MTIQICQSISPPHRSRRRTGHLLAEGEGFLPGCSLEMTIANSSPSGRGRHGVTGEGVISRFRNLRGRQTPSSAPSLLALVTQPSGWALLPKMFFLHERTHFTTRQSSRQLLCPLRLWRFSPARFLCNSNPKSNPKSPESNPIFLLCVTPDQERTVTTDRSAERGPSRRICARAVDSILRLGPGSAARLKSRLVRGDKIAVVSSGDETRRARSASAASPLDSVRGNEDWTRETHHEWWATKADKFRQVLRTAYGGTCDQPVCNYRREKSVRSRKPKTCRNKSRAGRSASRAREDGSQLSLG